MNKSKKLAKWFETEESKGFTEKQLVGFLLKKGYVQKDIEKAILYFEQKFHLKALLHIPWYLIISFFVSFLFLGYAFGEFFGSLKILGILVASVLLMDWFDRHNLDLASWMLLGFFYFLFFFISPLFFLIGFGSLISSVIIFFVKKKRINLYLINMALLISFFVTALIVLLSYLLIIYLIIPQFPTTIIIYLLLPFLPLVYVIPPLIYFFNHLALSRIK